MIPSVRSLPSGSFSRSIWLPSQCLTLWKRYPGGAPSGPFPPAFPPFFSYEDILWACHQYWVPSLPSCLRAGTPWYEEWHQHFAPTCGAGITNTLGMEAAGAGPLSATACSWVVADIPRMVAGGTLLVRSCRGYRSAPQVSGRQACTATLKASTKAWWSCPSSTFTPCSSTSILFMWACCSAQAVVVWHTLASFIALVAWASFRCAASSTLSSSFLQWKSMVAPLVSNCSRAMFIFSCSWSSSCDRQAGSLVEGAWGCVTKGMLAICSVFGGGSWEVTWVKLRVPVEVATWGDVCRRVATGTGVTGSSPLAWGDLWFSGCWQWLFPQSALPGGGGQGNGGSLLQLLHGAYEPQVNHCSDVAGWLSSVCWRG